MERLHAKPNTHYKQVPEPDITPRKMIKSRLGGVYETQQNWSLVIGHWSLVISCLLEITKDKGQRTKDKGQRTKT